MVFMFRLMGVNIREHHYSTDMDVFTAAQRILEQKKVKYMPATPPLRGNIYLVGHFIKPDIS
jgi:hypothetical protein